MCTGSFPGGKERPGRDADPLPPSSAVCLERVELYLYYPYVPYGLYRASVPVQGCTLPYLVLTVLLVELRLTLRRLMSYIYIEHPFLMFLDHTQRRSTVGRTPLDE